MFRDSFSSLEQMKTFVPQKVYGRKMKDADGRYNILINDKLLFHDLMSFYDIPTTSRYFKYSHNVFMSNGRVISGTDVDVILAGITDNRIFVKRSQTGEASGVFVARRQSDGGYYFDDTKLSSASIKELFGGDEIFVEKEILQDDSTRRYHPASCNTFRVLTYNNRVISACFRMGRGASFVDNYSKGGLVANIDIETGKLSDYAVAGYDYKYYFEHPDTGISFKDTVLPQWTTAKDLVERVCKVLPYYKSVGFDIACTKHGPVVVEINTGAEIIVNQMCVAKGLSDKIC